MEFTNPPSLPFMLMVTALQYSIAAVMVLIAIKFGILRSNAQLPTKTQRIGRVVSLFAGFFLIESGSAIMYGVENMVENFRQWNLLYLFKYVGVFEIIFGILILIPRTYKLGFLLALPLLGGGMATHFPTHTDGFVGAIPSFTTLTVLMISGFLYKPEIFPEWLTDFVFSNNKEVE